MFKKYLFGILSYFPFKVLLGSYITRKGDFQWLKVSGGLTLIDWYASAKSCKILHYKNTSIKNPPAKRGALPLIYRCATFL